MEIHKEEIRYLLLLVH